MNEQEILNIYLNLPLNINGVISKSPYIAAIMDARASTGRDINTGDITDYDKTGNWSGSLAYMALIDHAGKYIRLKEGDEVDGCNFIAALKKFTDLDDEKCFALYALRCSFFHEYSLNNVPKKGIKNEDLLKHRFIVTRGSGLLIDFPKQIWDCELENEANKTVIDLEELGNLVENMHKKILRLSREGKIKLSNGAVLIRHAA